MTCLLPKFIERANEDQVPPPYVFREVRVRSYRLDADRDALTAICDQQLNLARPGEYRPLEASVELELLDYPSMASEAKGFEDGTTSQQECVVRFSVGRFASRGATRPVQRLVFVPFIFVDNDASLWTGRQVLGYPKQRGWFENGVVRAMVLAHKTGPMTREPVVIVRHDRNIISAITQLWTGPWVSALAPRTMQHDMIHLKQIRDAEHTDRACYQAIVEAQVDVTHIHTVQQLPPARIEFPRYPKLRIADELGLEDTSVTCLSSYEAICTMRLRGVRTTYLNHGGDHGQPRHRAPR